jgi:hypothetical protein
VDSLDHLKAIQMPDIPAAQGRGDRVPKREDREAPVEMQMRRDLHAEGHAINVPTRVDPDMQPLGHVDAAMRLRVLMGDAWTADMFARLAELYPAGVPRTSSRSRPIACSGHEVETRAPPARGEVKHNQGRTNEPLGAPHDHNAVFRTENGTCR